MLGLLVWLLVMEAIKIIKYVTQSVCVTALSCDQLHGVSRNNHYSLECARPVLSANEDCLVS